jgi:hypothetical protein
VNSCLFIRRAAVPMLMAAAFCLPDASLAAGAQLAISATVSRFVTLSVLDEPGALVISEADAARGFVDVPRGARVSIRSNSREGFLLEFRNRLAGGPVKAIEVTGLGGAQLLDRGNGHIAVSEASRIAPMQLSYRILLHPAQQPGSYPWPVQLIASPH